MWLVEDYVSVVGPGVVSVRLMISVYSYSPAIVSSEAREKKRKKFATP